MNTSKLIFSAAIAVVGIGGASAADLPVKAPPMAVAAPYSWSGCYIGANVGGKWANNTTDTIFAPAVTGSLNAVIFTAPAGTLPLGSSDASSVIGGGQIGCNWQKGSWVFGVEADADAQSLKATQTYTGVISPFVMGDSFSWKSDWEASIRGRVGYAWDRTLVYVTGGAAFTNLRTSANYIAIGGFPASAGSDSYTYVGGTIGAGVEYALQNNWTVGVEGRYNWYGTHTFSAGPLATFGFPPTGPFLTALTTQTVHLETAEVMLRANWKFNSGPVVARY